MQYRPRSQTRAFAAPAFGGQGKPRAGRKGFVLLALGGFCLITLVLLLGLTTNLNKVSIANNSVETIVPRSLATVQVWAVKSDIRAGNSVSNTDFERVNIHRNLVPPDSIMDLKEIRDFFAATDLFKGVPITKGQFIQEVGKTELPVLPGMVAVGIPLTQEKAAGGNIQPGAMVDIVLNSKHVSDKQTSALIEKARVLAIDHARLGKKDQTERVYTSVTGETLTAAFVVELSKTDALRFQTARALGALSLSLRNPGDFTSSGPKYKTLTDLDIKTAETTDLTADFKNCNPGTLRYDNREYRICGDRKVEVIGGRRGD